MPLRLGLVYHCSRPVRPIPATGAHCFRAIGIFIADVALLPAVFVIGVALTLALTLPVFVTAGPAAFVTVDADIAFLPAVFIVAHAVAFGFALPVVLSIVLTFFIFTARAAFVPVDADITLLPAVFVVAVAVAL